MERWRRPVKPVAIEPDPSRIYHDGNVYRQQVDTTFSPEDFARIRLGYVCLRCWEPQEEAMPQSCSLCGYSMRDFQASDLEREFEGVKHLGPSTTIDEEVERMKEQKRKTSIWIPGAA